MCVLIGPRGTLSLMSLHRMRLEKTQTRLMQVLGVAYALRASQHWFTL